jgi:uncharacterized membrane protein YgcG
MKSTILLLAVATAALSSCTTAYKTGQTPDDVYFSPAPPQQDEYVQVQKKDERKYQNDQEYYDDRYLRMKVQNRTQWSDLDDYYYYDNRYNYSSYNNWNNPWSPNAYWNYYYNPYCNSCCIIGNGKNNNIVHGTPRIFNLNTYNSMALTNNNYSNGKLNGTHINLFGGLNNSTPATNNHNNNSGNFLRNIFTGNNNNNSSSNNSSGTKPSSSSGSSSGGSSGSSSSGSSAPVRRF